MSHYRLAFSTDLKLNAQCEKCKELVVQCCCKPEVTLPKTISTRLQLEKAKRGGKTVTVLRDLPPIGEFLKSLAKELKSLCGVGGTCGIDQDSGFVEIQGDKREHIRSVLLKKGFVVKG